MTVSITAGPSGAARQPLDLPAEFVGLIALSFAVIVDRLVLKLVPKLGPECAA
jgi:hypothetical protein